MENEQIPGVVDSSFESRENIERVEKMELDKKVNSFFIKRHSKYGATEENNGLDEGFLTKEGHEMAEDSAIQLGKKLEEIDKKLDGKIDVSIDASPSFMLSFNPKISPNYNNKFPEVIKPQRSEMTGMAYEERIFGGLSPGKGIMHYDGIVDRNVPEPLLDRKKLKTTSEQRLLGDFMENVDCEDKSKLGILIGKFFEIKKELYKNREDKFLVDFVKNELPIELFKALKACNGSTSLDLARNVTEYFSNKKEKTDEDRKEISIAITHGETMGSFLHYLESFAKSHENIDFDKTAFAHNEGFDAHIDASGHLVVAVNIIKEAEGEKKSSIKLFEVESGEFQNYLLKQKGSISTAYQNISENIIE